MSEKISLRLADTLAAGISRIVADLVPNVTAFELGRRIGAVIGEITESEGGDGLPAHLIPQADGRDGLRYMPPVEGAYGGHVEVYDSASHTVGTMWLKTRSPHGLEAIVHLSAANAHRLRDQLDALLEEGV
jgi:hypothetical protein